MIYKFKVLRGLVIHLLRIPKCNTEVLFMGMKQNSVKLEEEFLAKLQPIIDDYYNGDKSACIRSALAELIDNRQKKINNVPKEIIYAIEFILNLVLNSNLEKNKRLLEKEILRLWDMVNGKQFLE